MNKVKILAIDPSLRNTGMGILEFNTELPPNDPAAFTVSCCQVLKNPAKYIGTEAILNMMDMLQECAKNADYIDVDEVLVESPPIMFNKKWAAGTISSIAHVAGAATVLFGLEKSYLLRPNEWNKNRKKEITHAKTRAFLGNPDLWHYEKRVKAEKDMEHILDAISMALWKITTSYIED